MMKRLLAVIFLCVLSVSYGASDQVHLDSFSSDKINEIGERVFEWNVLIGDEPLLKVSLPESGFSMEQWQKQGRVMINWDHCRPEAMLAGAGELNQCIRRAFLSVRGEGDRLLPGSLEIQRLDHQKISFRLLQEGVSPLYFEASTHSQLPTYVGPMPASGQAVQNIEMPKRNRNVAAGTRYHLHTRGTGPVGFVFFGDSGTGKAPQYAVAKGVQRYCVSALCEFVALLGDNIYETGVSSPDDTDFVKKFEHPYQDIQLKFFAALGNHDHYGNIDAQIAYTKKSKKWRMPGRYYQFQHRGVGFFVIDSDDFDSTQQKWLDRKMGESEADWKIVYGHHPVYSYGSHGDTRKLIKSLLPLLQKHKVNFYLSGHDHDKQILKEGPIIFAVSGAAAKLRRVKKGKRTLFADSSYGFSHLHLYDELVDLKVMDQDGNVQYKQRFQRRRVKP